LGKRGEYLERLVVGVLSRNPRPLSAYDILHSLQLEEGKLAPPTVYRVLTTLQVKGHIHRIESLNAYVVCTHCFGHSASVMSICDDCGLVTETASNSLIKEIDAITRRKGFSPKRHIIEIHGSCQQCDEANIQ
jgi:Fur family zinc uptake transcriptional regulator